MPIIKRYPNRKLYDTEAKHYVTLEQITEMIRRGQEVHVVEHETGEDQTNMILTQVILEQERRKTGSLPRSLLTNLIRSSGETLEHMRHSMQESLDSALGSEQPLEKLIEGGKHSLEQSLRLDERIVAVLHSFNVPTQADLHRLQEQLDALEKQVDQLPARQKRTPKKAVRRKDASV